MSKIRRYYEDGAVYHLTCNTYGRTPLFKDKKRAEFLMNILGYYRTILKFKQYCFCIMPDHIHLIIQPATKKYNISVIMKHIKGSFATGYNNTAFKSGPVWQSRFYDTILRTEEELMVKINYVLQNPVRGGIVKEASEYPYSSAKAYLVDLEDRITDKYS